MYEREQFRMAKAAQQRKYNWEYGNQDRWRFDLEFSHDYLNDTKLCQRPI